MIDTIGRARLIGGVVLLVAFGAGVAVGHYAIPRRQPDGIMISVRGSTRIPEELEDLQLTDSQRTMIREFLTAGTKRIGRIVREFTVPIDAAIDTTDREIRSVLTTEQNRLLDEFRRERPLKRMEEKRVIDTIR